MGKEARACIALKLSELRRGRGSCDTDQRHSGIGSLMEGGRGITLEQSSQESVAKGLGEEDAIVEAGVLVGVGG